MLEEERGELMNQKALRDANLAWCGALSVEGPVVREINQSPAEVLDAVTDSLPLAGIPR